MRKGIGICSIALGVICLLGAVGFVVYNKVESRNGAEYSQTLLEDVQKEMDTAGQGNGGQMEDATEEIPQDDLLEVIPGKMPTVPAGSYASVGILSIPVLELELPVLENWSYDKLKKAPCQYIGTCYEPNFVIAAHNYDSHFGRLSLLQAGDLVIFTDVTGVAYCYEVVLLETLMPTATEEMITSGFDLTLYTCTPGGASRVTVRCNAVQLGN